MNYRKLGSYKECLVEMSGRFTFSDYQKFRELLVDLADAKNGAFVFDFKALEFIDSAAIGMLLIANDEANRTNTTIHIREPVGQVRKSLENAALGQLFHIE